MASSIEESPIAGIKEDCKHCKELFKGIGCKTHEPVMHADALMSEFYCVSINVNKPENTFCLTTLVEELKKSGIEYLWLVCENCIDAVKILLVLVLGNISLH